ncbi:hypothetical protein D3C81_1865640 [compost metagenome]
MQARTPRGTVVLSPGRTEPIEKYFEVIGNFLARGVLACIADGVHRAARRRSPPAPRNQSPSPPGGEAAPGTPIRGAGAAKAVARFTRAS